LDPHTVQPAPSKREDVRTTRKERKESSIDLTDEYLASVHSPYPDVMDLNRIDPSIALGFYCRDRKDFLELQKALTNPKCRNKSSESQLVSFVDKVPNYMSSTLVNDMIQDDDDLDCFDGEFDNPQKDEFSDEEDYVFL